MGDRGPTTGVAGLASGLAIDLDGIKAGVGKFGDTFAQQLSGAGGLLSGLGVGGAEKGGDAALTGTGHQSSRPIAREPDEEPAAKTTVARFVEVVAMFQTDYFVCGIAPFGPDRLVAFAFVDGGGGEAAGDATDGEAARAPSSRPEVRVLTWKNEDLTCDALTMKGYESFQAGDYHLAACVPDDDDRYDDRYDDASGSPSSDTAAYYLVSPRDVLVGKPRTVADRLRWLVEERGDYEAALEACDAAVASGSMAPDAADVFSFSFDDDDDERGDVPAIPRRRTVRDVIADAYLQSHLDAGDPARGASLCPRLLGTDALKWERWIARFAATPRALPHLAPYVPTEHRGLSTAAYERVLNAFLHDRRDHARFLATVKAWAPTIYSVPSMVSAVRRKMDTGAGGVRRRCGRRWRSCTWRTANAIGRLGCTWNSGARPSSTLSTGTGCCRCAPTWRVLRTTPRGNQHAREVGEVGSVAARATMLADAEFCQRGFYACPRRLRFVR